MGLYYTSFEPCDTNLFIMSKCRLLCAPGWVLWILQCCCVWKHWWQVLMLQEQRCVCVTTALTGTAAGEASSIVFILPLFVSPALPSWFSTWPSGNRSCGRKTSWGLIGLGRRISPGMLWPLSGGGGCYQLCPMLPEQHSGAWECSTLWEDVMSGKGDWPFSFFPLSLFEENLPLVTLQTGDQLSLTVGHL